MNQIGTAQRPLAKFRTDFLRLTSLALLFLILPVLLIIAGALNNKQDWFLTIPLVVVPVGVLVYNVIVILINFDLEVLVYDDGFRYTNKGKTRKYSWKEIDKVWTTRFTLISLIYIKFTKVKILDTAGNILILDRTLRKVDKLEAIIQEQVARDKFTQVVPMLQQGMSLKFGALTVTKDCIKNEHDTILWSELGDIQTWQGSIRLWKKGKRSISILAGIASIPNFTLLISLIRYLSKTAQSPAPPLQDIKNERNVPPEKIGRAIALVKSGDKEGGKKLLFEIVGSDPGNETAWSWLVSVVPPDQRIFCLEKILSLNPANLQARQYLEKLKAAQPSEPVSSKPGGRIKPAGNTDARLSGLFFFVMGAGLGYWQIILPLEQALRHEPYISYYSEAAILTPIAIFLGLFLLVFGAEGLGFISKPSKLGAVLLLLGILVLVLGCFLGMQFIMKSLGYY